MHTSRITFYRGFVDALQLVPELHRPALLHALEDLKEGQWAPELQAIGSHGLQRFAVPEAPLHVVCHQEPGVLVMLFVGSATEATSWADQFRVRRVGNTLRVTPLSGPPPSPPAPVGRGPLSRYRRRQLARFGIGPAAAQVLRRLQSEDEVLELADLMRASVRDLVLGLLTDEPLHELEARFEQAEAHDPGPVAQDATNAAHLYTPSSREELLAAITGAPEAWAVFPHPQQKRAITARTSGPAKVVGGPGTGKTVVAVHRAQHLAREVFVDDGRPVLLTVFSPMLTLPLQRMVDHLCAPEPAVRDRIEVLDLVAAAQRILAAAGLPHERATQAELDRAWEIAQSEAPGLGWTKPQLQAERTHVLGRNGAWTWDAYRDTPRQGRAVALAVSQRELVWRALAAFERSLVEAGVGDGLALVRAAEQAVLEQERSPWVAAICDEVQDANASELRLLAAISRDPVARAIRPDGLFLVGDGYQRVYARPVPLTQCGIEVRGRSWTLRVNYRSTEQIREAAMSEVAGMEPDVLDAGTEDSQDGYHSERTGEPPSRHPFATTADEAAWISARAAEGPLLVLTRHPAYRNQLARALGDRGLPVEILEGVGMPGAGVTLSTIHRAKGLEAPRVVVAGAHEMPAPFRGHGEAERQWWERHEQCLSYVAMTRARDWLAITHVADADPTR